MKHFAQAFYGLTAMLVAASVASAAPAAVAEDRQPVIQFLSAGDEAAIRLDQADRSETLLLKVFGRTLAKLSAQAGVVRFRAPEVRTVTRLTLSPSGDRAIPVAEVFVYPKDFRLPWDGESSLRLATPSPQWIAQWLHAAGLPFEEVDPAKLTSADRSQGVLIIAGAAAGRTALDFDRQYRTAGRNVLLLSAPWFGPATRDETLLERIVAGDLTGPLEAPSSTSWSRAVEFGIRQQPWPERINRRTWITGQHGPIVEELFTDWKQGSVIAGYVPWQLQLGRNEIADQLFLDLLQAVAEHRPHRTERRFIRLQYPAAGLPDAIKRPILTVAAAHQPQMFDGPILEVFDFRGADAESLLVETILQDIRKRAGQSPVLVLGCDSLRHVERAILREQKKSNESRPSLTWISSDRQPPATQDQVHLMEVLTMLGVQLGTLSSAGAMK